MAFRKEFKITTSTTTTLITKSASSSEGFALEKIIISNNDASNSLTDVSVFLEDATASADTNVGNIKHYFIFELNMPPSTSIVLDDSVLFDSGDYNLRISTGNDSGGGAAALTVIIR
jgi:uncharacterized protein (UPF0333 family)